MNARKRLSFDYGWREFEDHYAPSNRRVLDALLSNELITDNDYRSHYQLKDKERMRLLQFIKTALLKSTKGYDVFLSILEKDYDWISKKMVDVEEEELRLTNACSNALNFGQVPENPKFFVERTSKLEELQKKLRNMNAGHKIILHGMVGTGKTSLAAASVRDRDLLINKFNNKIYWIVIDVKDKTLEIMDRLFRKIVHADPELANLRTIEKPINEETMKDNFVILLQYPAYKQALIVLDNVHSSDLVTCFDVGWYLLVISQTKIELNQNNTSYIEMIDGFSKTETENIFSRCLQVPTIPSNLSYGLHKTYDFCRGDIMMTALIAADISHRRKKFLEKPDEWDKLITRFSKNNTQSQKINEILKYYMDQLEPDTKTKFQDLVVFLEDTNLLPDVLSVIWDINIEKVENILQVFVTKSFISEMYSHDHHTYIYEIHPTCLKFLASFLKKEEIKKFHQKLINNYHNKYSWENLPNDNYIHHFIGYHLKKGGMNDKFKIYFNLNFLESKIKYTGIAGLLYDFDVYKDYITNKDETLENKLHHYRDFIRKYGQNLNVYEDTNLIQSALFLPIDNPVYKAAKEIAMKNTTNLYFQTLAPHASNYYVHELTLNNAFKTACFSEETNKILVGTENGQIELWEGLHSSKLQTYEGHTYSIKSLKVNITKTSFLSLDTAGKLKLWNLFCSSHNSIKYENGQQYSPRVLQSSHQPRFSFDATTNKCETINIENDKISCASFSNDPDNDRLILIGTENGQIRLWNKEPKCIITPQTIHAITSVNFSNDGSVIIASFDKNICLYKNSECDPMRLQTFTTNFYINEIHICPDDNYLELIAVQDKCISIWSWEQEFNPNHEIQIKNIDLQTIYEDLESPAIFQCSKVIENYLVTSSSDLRIRMWDLYKTNIVEEFYHPTGEVISLDASLDHTDQSIHILLTGFDDKTLKMWHVQPNDNDTKIVKKLPIFSVHWGELYANSPLLAVATAEQTIQVMKGYNLISEIEKIGCDIEEVIFSSNGEKVFYGLKSGEVYMCEIKTKRKQLIMCLKCPVVYLDVLEQNTLDDLLVAASNSGKLFVYKNKEARKLKESNPSKILKCFYIASKDKVLVVTTNSIAWFNLQDYSYDTLLGNVPNIITSSSSTCISSDCTLLCRTLNDNVQVFSLNENGLKISWSDNLKINITCCCFSANKMFLALGLTNGKIMIWNFNSRKMIKLEEHTTAITCLEFSPSGLILISLSEQIMFWNLEKVPIEQNGLRRSTRSRSNSIKKPASIDLSSSMSLLSLGWSNKKGSDKKPHLLSCIKFHGLYANKILFSTDFKSFVTVDNQGELYIMDILDNATY